MYEHSLVYVYVIISALAVIADVYTFYKCINEKKDSAKWLSAVALGSALVQVSYLASVFANSYFLMSLASSLYFLSVSFSVFSLFVFYRIYVRTGFGKREIISYWVLVGFLAIDAIGFAINPFKEIAVRYYDNGQALASYSYDKLPLFWFHLVWLYLALIVTFVNIVKGARRVPKIYRKPFIYSIYIMVAVIAINALYLYFPSVFGGYALDYSTWGYSIAVMMIYNNCYIYASTGMKPFYHTWIVENVNQGVVLFDYANRLSVNNSKVKLLLPNVNFEGEMRMEDFVKQLNIELKKEKMEEDFSLQFYVSKGGQNKSLRLDHRCLRSESNEIIGQLLVFTDEIGDVDVLTNFYNWNVFKAEVTEVPENYEGDALVIVSDINGLGEINSTYGKATGDRAISILAESMRKNFPMESHFVRGQEASLVVIAYGMSLTEAINCINKVQEDVKNQDELPCAFNIQSAYGARKDNEDILEIIKLAFKSLQNKKLLDARSPKSELVRSLVKTLEEVDYETQEHVKRTQAMGFELGKRLGLSDIQLSDLALLCILHDIGKIGIPLNILNKPGKLNDSEWKVMKSHTEKGYQIARSAKELQEIADMILHHHECWDGRGYPDGLSKESIPLLSRIISVVDSYDAMVSDRPYRKGMSPERAIVELKRCAGTQFDPVIVNEFIAMLPEIKADEASEEAITMPAQMPEIEASDKDADTSNVYTVSYSRYILDNNQRIVDVNDVFVELTGYTKEDILNSVITQADLVPEEDRTGYFMLVEEQITKNAMAYFEHRIKCKDGTYKRVLCMGRLYYDSAVGDNRTEIIVIDSTETHAMKAILDEEHVKAQERLQRWEGKYRTDSLTGLLTHEAFRSEVDLRLVENINKIMFIMLDVDKFKEYNDTKGHKAGDEFLITLGQSLSEAMMQGDLVSRMGGDEFACALVYPPTASDEVMYKRARQIFEKVNYILMTEKSGTTLSMGVAISRPEYNTFNKLYEASDKALYEAKDAGRSQMAIAKLD